MTAQTRLQRISRRGLISSGVLAGVLAATGVQVQARARRGVLRLGLSGAAGDWRAPGAFMRVATAGAVYETLTEITARGELVGELAESWEPQEAAAAWTVDLRRGLAFHDGREVTAADVAASFTGLGAGDPALTGIRRIRALGPHRLRFELYAPDANLPLRLADPHLTVAPGGVFDGVGSGLYRLAEFAPGERMLLNRVEQHWRDGRAGWFDSVVLRAIPGAAARSAALAAGHVDAVDMPGGGEGLGRWRNLRLLESSDQGLGFTDLAQARDMGLAPRPGMPPGPARLAPEAYALPGLTGWRYGAGLQSVIPGQAAFADEDLAPAPEIAGHLPLALAHVDRLRHEDGVGWLSGMDDFRIAQRWWFA